MASGISYTTASASSSLAGDRSVESTPHRPTTTVSSTPAPSILNSPQTSTVSSTFAANTAISFESPLPPVVQRCLGDRSYDKRKNAALEIEALIKSLQEANNTAMIQAVISVLSKDFSTSMNANYRKGGLIGIAATAIGLMHSTKFYLDSLLPPVLHCFDDPESRVRYYACESLYNIAKVARTSILRYFSSIFDGLCKLYADVDVDVKNGAGLLDRLIKDIVTESDTFKVEQFIPLLQNYIKRTNPYIRQLLLGWITALDSVPDISMVDYLPDFLDGLFNMLGDSNREIRQAADAALSEFLREVRQSTVLEQKPISAILVHQCHSKERLNRLTAISWLAELIHHPYSNVLPYHAEILGAIMRCISDGEVEIRKVAERTNDDLLLLVKDTAHDYELSPLLHTLTTELMSKDDVPTKMAALRWINMLLEKRPRDMNAFLVDLLPVLLRTLSDVSDDVVLLNLQVLSRISLAHDETDDKTKNGQFPMVLNAILSLFSSNRRLLETRGSLIIRKLCVLLNAETVYITMADSLSSSPLFANNANGAKNDESSLEFIATMVQTLNLILLTAAELHELRSVLASSFQPEEDGSPPDPKKAKVFHSLFHCWCHNPASTFALCLLAQAYPIAIKLIQKFSQLDVSVGFLMQIDKLVQLLESPVFVHLRLQLLDVESPHYTPLLKSCYGLLMLLPQSDAFCIWNHRLSTVCNLRDSLGGMPSLTEEEEKESLVYVDSDKLLARFDHVMDLHQRVRESKASEQLISESVSTTLIKNSNGMVIPKPSYQNLSDIGGGVNKPFLTPLESNVSESSSRASASNHPHHHDGSAYTMGNTAGNTGQKLIPAAFAFGKRGAGGSQSVVSNSSTESRVGREEWS